MLVHAMSISIVSPIVLCYANYTKVFSEHSVRRSGGAYGTRSII